MGCGAVKYTRWDGMGWDVGCVAVKHVSLYGMWGGKIYEMGWVGMWGCNCRGWFYKLGYGSVGGQDRGGR